MAHDRDRQTPPPGDSSRFRPAEAGLSGLVRACYWDLVYALKALRAAPSLVVAVIGSLVVGVGVNTGVFAVAEAVLLRPLPYVDADRVVCVSGESGQSFITFNGNGFELTSRSWSSSSVFSAAGAYAAGGVSLADDPAERLRGAAVTAGFFPAVGARPQVGRVFDEPALEADPNLAVISNALWHRRFAADPHVIGATLHLNGIPFTVVAVLNPGAEFPGSTEVWIPASQGDELGGMITATRVIARLAPGVAVLRARDEVTRIDSEVPAYMADRPGPPGVGGRPEKRGERVSIVPLREELVGKLRPILFLVGACAGLVLLVGGVNASNLLLGRVYSRGHEHAIRRALGASPSRVARQIYIEIVLLAVGAGAASIPIVYWTLHVARSVMPAGLAAPLGAGVNVRTMAGAGCLALLTGLVVGVLPALSSVRATSNPLGKDEGAVLRNDAWQRLRGGLVVAELSCALIALVAALTLARTVAQLTDVDLGAHRDSALTFKLDLPPQTYPPGPRIAAVYDRFEAALRGVAGVKAVGATDQLPGDADQMLRVTLIRPEGLPSGRSQGRREMALRLHATPGYFAAIGISLLAGRGFEAKDAAGAPPVVIVSRGYATVLGLRPSEVVGRRQNIGTPDNPRLAEIVGVVEDVRLRGPESRYETALYVPFAQESFLTNRMHVALDADPRRTDCIAAVREAARQFDPTVPLGNIRTLAEIRAGYVRDRHVAMVLMSFFAGLAATLAAVGVYAAIAFLVQRKTREIGIRLALGAAPGAVRFRVLRVGVGYGGAGVVVGGMGGWGAMKVVTAQIAGIRPLEPMLLAAAAAFVLLLAALASWIPARRATLVDPCETMRCE